MNYYQFRYKLISHKIADAYELAGRLEFTKNGKSESVLLDQNEEYYLKEYDRLFSPLEQLL